MSEKGGKRFLHYAESQRWIWAKVKELQDRYDLDEGIDVIADALALYEAHLEEKARKARAEKEDQAHRDQDGLGMGGHPPPGM